MGIGINRRHDKISILRNLYFETQGLDSPEKFSESCYKIKLISNIEKERKPNLEIAPAFTNPHEYTFKSMAF